MQVYNFTATLSFKGIGMFKSNLKKILLLVAIFNTYALFGNNSNNELQQSVEAEYDQNFSLVQMTTPDLPTTISANPKFLLIVPDMHHLINRSYKSTKRDSDRHYLHREMLEHDEHVTIFDNNHHWHCLKNFQGEQGNFVTTNFGWKIVKCCLYLFTGGNLQREIDYPGFVAYSTDADPMGSIIWVAIVLRGSQGEDFQPINGMFEASWITNYNAGSAILDKNFYPFPGYAHSGYLNKILACEISMRNAINQALCEIGQENFHKVRFIVTGHSQGGGLAQVALPIIVKDYEHIYEKGEEKFSNINTPRFFGYFLSAPRALSGQNTVNQYNQYIGEDNMIRHQAYGDIVPMVCLPSFLPVGHLAIDTFYDTICRAIRSESAYCNRYMLFWAIKDLFDPAKFIIDEQNNTWTSIHNPEFEINWTELCKVICSQSTLHDLSEETLFRPFLKRAFKASHPVKTFENTKELPNVSDQFLLSLLKTKYDLLYVEKILRYFAVFEDIRLEEKKKERIFMVSDIFEEYFGNHEKYGVTSAINNYTSLNAATNTLNKFKDFEKFVNQDLEKIVPKDGIIVDHKITPTGDSSAIAYAHYGSASNYYKSKLFDHNIPSKNLDLALRNGYELICTKQNKKKRCVFVYEERLPRKLFDILITDENNSN